MLDIGWEGMLTCPARIRAFGGDGLGRPRGTNKWSRLKGKRANCACSMGAIGGGILRRFMHAEDVPVIFGFAAEHHAAAGGVNGWGFDGVVVEAPNHVADSALIFHGQGKVGARSQAKIRLLKMVSGLVAPAEFSGGRAQGEIGIEAGGERGGVGVIECCRAGMHSLFHFRDDGDFRGAGSGDAEARDAALEVYGYAELFEKVNAEDSIERGTARFGES